MTHVMLDLETGLTDMAYYMLGGYIWATAYLGWLADPVLWPMWAALVTCGFVFFFAPLFGYEE